MVNIAISEHFKEKWAEIKLGCIECDVEVVDFDPRLWDEISKQCLDLKEKIVVEDISKIPAVSASRKAYKKLGKDPARYRLSAEALIRRVLKGNKLYQINNVVDLVNLASIVSGFSIGGYDADKIQSQVKLGVGEADEPYQAIGRGQLNIRSLPVLRDNIGAFGSPTSDSERTSVNKHTKRFLMVYFGFGSHELLSSSLAYGRSLLEQYARAVNIEQTII